MKKSDGNGKTKGKPAGSKNACNVFIHTLGCPKNEVDSEVMAGLFAEEGLTVVEHPEDAGLLVVNTCCFIDEAKEESIEAILEAGKRKGAGKLLVTGCLAERYGPELREEMPEIDGLVGVRSITTAGEVAARMVGGVPGCDRDAPGNGDADGISERRRSLGTTHTAYIKIAEGCDRPCAFCSIPSFRGPLASRSVESLVRETERLARLGAKEIVLVGQETTAFGADRGEKDALPRLFDALAEIEAVRWIRLLYAYPTGVTQALVERLGRGNACRYIDMPVQHISTSVLKRMRRGMSGDEVRRAVDRVRSAGGKITLRSTVLVGFPGETDTDFRLLADFVRESRFDHLGVFRFSPQEKTAAASLDGAVPEEISRERQQEILDIQTEIMDEKGERRVGERLTVLVDEIHEGESWCRTERDAPEIDGVVILPGAAGSPGKFLEAKIVDSRGPVLFGEKVS